MQRVLFHDTIFGPIHSRRLGTSLGINLTPNDGKICTFDCLYCEAGFNAQGPGSTGMATREDTARLLEEKLADMREKGEDLDVITFSGNGEPTIHPRFAEIVDDTLRLRDKYFPKARVSVLSNATQIHRPDVVEALRRVDNNILKLDSAIPETVALLDRPTAQYSVPQTIEALKQFAGTGIIQTMLLRGTHDGKTVDNTTDAEIRALAEAYRAIAPASVMVYSIDRKTPAEHLCKIDPDELSALASRLSSLSGIPVTTA